MLGRRVMCMVRSAYETKSVFGIIVKESDNYGIYTLKLDHPVDFFNGKVYSYKVGSTMLVSSSEIMR